MRTQTDWQIVRPVHTHPPLCQPISTCSTSLTELPVILYLLIKKNVTFGRSAWACNKTKTKPHFEIKAFRACFSITKTCLYNFDPLRPHFYIVKLGFAGVQVIFLISAQNIDCGYSLEPPRRGGSNEYPQSMF